MKGLYLVTPDWDDTEKLLEVTEMAMRGGAALVQYRHKNADDALRRMQAECLLDLCRAYGRPFIVNDHVDLCLAIGADGVHVGGKDVSVAAARAALGPDRIVGASCYGELDLAHRAHASGASYVAFGGFYASRVKHYPVTTSADIVTSAKRALPLPLVVIGGMTPANAAPLVACGADMVAAISDVYLAGDPEAAARTFVQMFST
ncbi:MAG: thiamine phosphate synthase [Herminiimonas sp.]|nr:thiamine phosphate synthase [Herminiimonas sp.]